MSGVYDRKRKILTSTQVHAGVPARICRSKTVTAGMHVGAMIRSRVPRSISFRVRKQIKKIGELS